MRAKFFKNENTSLTDDRDEMFSLMQFAILGLESKMQAANGMELDRMTRQYEEWTETLEEMRAQ